MNYVGVEEAKHTRAEIIVGSWDYFCAKRTLQVIKMVAIAFGPSVMLVRRWDKTLWGRLSKQNRKYSSNIIAAHTHRQFLDFRRSDQIYTNIIWWSYECEWKQKETEDGAEILCGERAIKMNRPTMKHIHTRNHNKTLEYGRYSCLRMRFSIVGHPQRRYSFLCSHITTTTTTAIWVVATRSG